MRRVGMWCLALAIAACTTISGEPSSTSGQGSTSTTPTATGWVEVAPMTVARSEHPGVVVNSEIVVVGGLIEIGVGRRGVTDSVEAYSPDTDTWRDLPDLPQAIHHGMAAVVGDRLLVMGGYSPAGDPVDTVWELVDGQWLDRAPLPTPVGAGAAVALEGTVHVVGGIPNGGHYSYDLVGETWAELPAPRGQREHLAAAVLDGKVWAIGGRWEGDIFDTTEIYDPDTESWRAGPVLNEARSGFGAVGIDGAVVVAGGEVFSPEEALDSVERLDEQTPVWTFLAPLPLGLHGNPLLQIDGDLYLPGGSSRAGDVVNDGRAYRFNLQ